jgi:hypothetical protein
VADPAKNGSRCTEQCFDCGSPLPCNNDPGGCQNGVFNNQRCVPDGSCQDGTCQPGPGTYECDPSPFLFCCFEQGICSNQC